MATTKSGLAMLKVLESWGVSHLYGIPGGSFNSTMDALFAMRDSIGYVQVRHEETGAIAAAVDAKLTGNVGVCFGSAGPGATHLMNGLYDAKLDRAPVLALIGQVASTAMNFNSFQELNENPMFTDVSVYNRTAMTPESLPGMVDDAIRWAQDRNDVAVVTIPVDYGFADIPDGYVSSAPSYRKGYPKPDGRDIEAAARLLAGAKRPVLYIGQGTRGSGDAVAALSERCSMPIVSSVLGKGIVPDSHPNFLGMAARVATKPANEALAAADLILFVGSDFPFARFFFPNDAKFIQIDVEPAKLGRRHRCDAAILGDAGEVLRALAEECTERPADTWLEANRRNMAAWRAYLKGFETSRDMPLRVEPVFREINRIATEDAVFVTDVGNSTIHAIRLLDMNGRQRFTTSGLFATMGYGVPGGIAAKLSFPKRQVFTLNGDGAFSMAMQDITTQVKYGLAVINVVFSNDSLGFIEAEQEDTKQSKFGVDLYGVDFAMAGRAMGAKGITVARPEEIGPAFDAAREADGPVVIDVKIGNRRPFPAEAVALDPHKYSPEEIAAFKNRYEVGDMPVLRELLA